jgi:membrane fusion protein, multidrug efflux system
MSRVLDRKHEQPHRDSSIVRSSMRLAAIGLCALTLAACSPKNEKAASPLPVTVQTVHAGSGAAGNAYSGGVVADTQVDVAFKVNGYVQTILQVKGADGRLRNVQAGDKVTSGVVLASIRDDTYRQTLLKAQSDLENARATQTKAKADFARFSQLFEKKVISPAEYDTYKQRADSAQASVGAAQAAVRHAQVDLEDCKLKAPLSGLVLDRKIEVGTLVAPNTVGFQIGDTAKVKVVFGVPGAIVSSLAPNTPVTMATDAFPGEVFQGTISKIASAADPNSRIFDVEATFPNSDGRLRVGMVAALHLPNNAQRQAMPAVPMRSIVRPPDDPRGYAVYVVEEQNGAHVARLKPVTIGPVVGDEVSVESGLDPGVKVIVKGSDIVYDGQSIRIVP